MSRVFNFSAGPAVLPEEVLITARDQLLEYGTSGMSVMEMSHRSKDFEDILDAAEADLRTLMNIPENYKVLFLQGGGCTQFAMIPMNLMRRKSADYIITGQWSKKAASEAKIYGTVNEIASSADKNFSYVPDFDGLKITPGADYVYICQNETIHGTTIRHLPDTKDTPLVADVSSMFLSEPLDVSRYGIIWGGVQKNVGPAGVTIVIIREDLIHDEVLPFTPTMLKYKTHSDNKSLYNTPPCWNIYICGLVFKWLLKLGGTPAIHKLNQEKAKILYDYFDQSELFHGTVRKQDRSLMNIPFVTGNKDIDSEFASEASKAGLKNLKGHRSVGGMRASLYNAMPIEGVKALVEFMADFERKH